MRAWSLTDGTADFEDSCLAVAEAVADRVERRRVSPRALWRFLPRWAPIDPREAPERGAGPIAPRPGDPWPELIVAAGARSARYLARAKKASEGRSLAVFLGSGAPSNADLVVTLNHELPGPAGSLSVAVPPHRIDPVRLLAARGGPPPVTRRGAGPLVGVVIGEGPGRHGMTPEDLARLAASLARVRSEGATIAIRAPRTVGEGSLVALRAVAHYTWDGEGPDPQLALMAHADALVTAATSARIVSESLAAGTVVYAFVPTTAATSVCSLVSSLARRGYLQPFTGQIEHGRAPILDSTREIARAIDAMISTRAVLRPGAGAPTPRRQRETNGPTSR
jgi:mitochondrial fission protein ELM1